MFFSSLTKVDLDDTDVNEIPAFVYGLPHLKTLSITSLIDKPTAFHSGMKELTHIKIKHFVPRQDILELPDLQELDAYYPSLPKASQDVVRALREKGVTGMRYKLPEDKS